MTLSSLIFSMCVEMAGVAIALIAGVALFYTILRNFYSLRKSLAICFFFIGILALFCIPEGIFRGFGYSSFVKTYGPTDGPGLPFANAIDFLTHFNQFEQVSDISRNPNDLPPPISRTATTTNRINITAKEVISQIAPGVYQNYWTFDGAVPGPFLRVIEGDTVIITFHNDSTSLHHHTIDFHAVIGPGGGASVLAAMPGETKTLTFTAVRAGLFVYHCAEPNPAVHMAHGQYGMILVEPKGGMPKADKEFYIMQSEFYTTGLLGKNGLQVFDSGAMLAGKPQYIVFNGRTGALTGATTMQAEVGQVVRIYFGNAGVNLISSFHVIGEIFDRVYEEASITSPPLTNIQTTLVPAGGATVVDFSPLVPGNYTLVDHALSRIDRGSWGVLHVDGPTDSSIFNGIIQNMQGH